MLNKPQIPMRNKTIATVRISLLSLDLEGVIIRAKIKPNKPPIAITAIFNNIGKNTVLNISTFALPDNILVEIETTTENNNKPKILSRAITFKVLSTKSPLQRYCLIVIIVEPAEVVDAIAPRINATPNSKLQAHITKVTPTAQITDSHKVITIIF